MATLGAVVIIVALGIDTFTQLRSSYDDTANGQIAKSVVLVRVQWAWLTLPLFVVLASPALVLAQMMHSRRGRGVSLWKSLSTALLFHSSRTR